MTTMTPHALRLANADQSLELYDFGHLEQRGSDGWDEDRADPNKWTKNVYLFDPEAKSECRVLFVVRFDPENGDVHDAYHDY